MRNAATASSDRRRPCIEVLRQARWRPSRDPADLADRNPALYSGMLPGLVAGQYRTAELSIDAVALARRAGAEVVLEEVTRVDGGRRGALTASGRQLAFDVASLDVGRCDGSRSARRGDTPSPRPSSG
jgi:NADH dehydrogenase FAD-containing subunit